MKSFYTLSAILAAAQTVSARYGMYIDMYHYSTLPDTTVTEGIDTVFLAFANTSLFTTSPRGQYTPFISINETRALFPQPVDILISLGGWGDTAGLSAGAATAESRKLYAQNVADMLEELGADGCDVDWEYPGGNGADYIETPNSEKVDEITTFPLLLEEIKLAIAPKLLSIAAPGLKDDMIAYTAETGPKIAAAVDFVNVMSYDLMNRRDNVTEHHTSVVQSLESIQNYLDIGIPAEKLNLGFAFYAKWFKTDPNSDCDVEPLGCATALLETSDGTDTGNSGTITFEAGNYAVPPANLSASTDGSCGASVNLKCGTAGACCSQYGFCGTTSDYCGAGCVDGYGAACTETSINTQFRNAMANGIADEDNGGEYYWDSENNVFWTWDTPHFIAEKFEKIVQAKGLGGVYAWSLGEDSYKWEHIAALREGMAAMGVTSNGTADDACESDYEKRVVRHVAAHGRKGRYTSY